MAAKRRGVHLKSNEVYDFAVAPVLGGAVDVENIVSADLVVAMNITGQLHAQVRHLPPGTPIGRIRLTD